MAALENQHDESVYILTVIGHHFSDFECNILRDVLSNPTMHNSNITHLLDTLFQNYETDREHYHVDFLANNCVEIIFGAFDEFIMATRENFRELRMNQLNTNLELQQLRMVYQEIDYAIEKAQERLDWVEYHLNWHNDDRAEI